MLQVNWLKAKHRIKCIRKWKEIIKLVIGKDVGLEDVNNMTDNSLNGYFEAKLVLQGYMTRWIEDLWLGFYAIICQDFIFSTQDG